METTPRYAIYFTPDPKGTLWRFGSGVIGYDANSGTDVPLAVPQGFDLAGWALRTGEPRRYGFHATLKAPFYLAAGRSERDLLARVEALAQALACAHVDELELTTIGSFTALVIAGDDSEVRALASEVVTELEPLRAPLTVADRERRLGALLTPRQQLYLDRYGYPSVLDEFRFHMTLTGKLPAGEREPIRGLLERAFRAALPVGSFSVDHLSVLRQDRRDGRFRLIARFPLGGRKRPPAAPR